MVHERAGATITPIGFFTPSTSLTAETIYTITATSTQDPTKSGSAMITVDPIPTTVISVAPSCVPAKILTNQTSSCTASVQGTGNFNNGVNWTSSGGNVTPSGTFNPPAVTTETNVTITATSKQDNTKTGATSVIVDPVPASISLNTIPNQSINLGFTLTPIDVSTYVMGGTAPFTYTLVSQSASGVVNCTMSGSQVTSDAAYNVNGGSNAVTVEVTDSKNASAQTTFTVTVNVPTVLVKQFGYDFSPYGPGQDPNLGTIISCTQITQMMGVVAPYTQAIRSFGVSDGLDCIGPTAHKFGRTAYISAWLSGDLNANATEMNIVEGVAQTGGADYVIIGSENLLRGDLTASQLIEYINEFRAAVPGVPVGTADITGEILNNPAVVNACDFVMVNIYPYWEKKDISVAVAYLNAEYNVVVKTYPDKEIIVGETGWPSDGTAQGAAVPSLANAAYFFLDYQSWAQAEQVKTFHFEVFDEAWKAAYEGPQGAFWGRWDQLWNMKYGSDVSSGVTVLDNWSCGAPPGGDGTPSLVFTYVPPIGSIDYLQGQEWHVPILGYYVVVYIHVGNGWWVKPYADSPLTTIACDGTWATDIVTGGSDASADQIAAFLIPSTYNPPILLGAQTLPADLATNSVASVSVSR